MKRKRKVRRKKRILDSSSPSGWKEVEVEVEVDEQEDEPGMWITEYHQRIGIGRNKLHPDFPLSPKVGSIQMEAFDSRPDEMARRLNFLDASIQEFKRLGMEELRAAFLMVDAFAYLSMFGDMTVEGQSARYESYLPILRGQTNLEQAIGLYTRGRGIDVRTPVDQLISAYNMPWLASYRSQASFQAEADALAAAAATAQEEAERLAAAEEAARLAAEQEAARSAAEAAQEAERLKAQAEAHRLAEEQAAQEAETQRLAAEALEAQRLIDEANAAREAQAQAEAEAEAHRLAALQAEQAAQDQENAMPQPQEAEYDAGNVTYEVDPYAATLDEEGQAAVLDDPSVVTATALTEEELQALDQAAAQYVDHQMKTESDQAALPILNVEVPENAQDLVAPSVSQELVSVFAEKKKKPIWLYLLLAAGVYVVYDSQNSGRR